MATTVLNFNMQPQQNTQWCWAATSTSVALFYNPSSGWTQCKVANATLPRTDCCSNPTSDPCNIPYYLDDALTLTGNLVNVVANPIQMDQIEDEVNAIHIIGVRIGWHEGGGHFIALYGYDDSTGADFVYSDDPIYGKVYSNLANFTNNYQSAGSWTHTYFTKPAGVGGIMAQFANLNIDLPKKIDGIRRFFKFFRDRKLPQFAVMHPAEPKGYYLKHDVYLIKLKDLLGGSKEFQKIGVRVLDSTDRENELIFEFDKADEDAQLLQVIHGNTFNKIYHDEARKSIFAKLFDAGDAEIRVVKQPELKMEALWMHSEKNDQQDEFVPVIESDRFKVGRVYTYAQFFDNLISEAYKFNETRKDDRIGG